MTDAAGPGSAEPSAGMTAAAGTATALVEPAGDTDATPRRGRRPVGADLRFAARTVGALAAIGALLGVLWSAWSPPGPPAIIFGNGAIEVIGETESSIAGDGRFLVIVTVVGIVAPLLAWFGRPARRGTATLLGLAVGTMVGALLTDLVGRLTGGGSYSGRVLPLSDGTHQQVSRALPLTVHLPGLLFVEPALAVLVYGLFTAFAVRDDLGRADPARDAELARRPERGPHPVHQEQLLTLPPIGPPAEMSGSVGPGVDAQDRGGNGDAAGGLQQRDLPSQES